jgi:hypothetical protein
MDEQAMAILSWRLSVCWRNSPELPLSREQILAPSSNRLALKCQYILVRPTISRGNIARIVGWFVPHWATALPVTWCAGADYAWYVAG